MPFLTILRLIARDSANFDEIRSGVVIVAFIGLHRSNQMLSLLAPSLYKGMKDKMSSLELTGDLSTFVLPLLGTSVRVSERGSNQAKPMKDLFLNGI